MTTRELLVKINGDSRGLDQAIGGADKVLGKFGISINGVTSLLTGPAGIAAAAGIAAKAIWDIGIKFDEASANIAKATGATGAQLEKLNFIFRNTMAAGIEQSIDEVSNAFGEIQTRFSELGGSDLKKVTLLFSDFADVTKQDMVPAVQDVSQLMRNWGSDTQELPGILDRLYASTAQTGISIQELTGTLSAGGAVLRQAGYNLKDATALIASFYAAGIDSSRMLVGLNAALAKFAKDGVDAKTGIAQVFDEIKNAKSSTEATARAVEIFGSRVGPQLSDAIRSGKVSIEAMTASLDNAQGAVLATAEASETLNDKWMKFQNAASASGSRMGEYWIELAKIGLDILVPMMSNIARFGEAYFEQFVNAAKKIWTAIKPVFEVLTQYLGGVIDFWAGVLTGNWKLVWNGLQRSALSVALGITKGIELLVENVTKGLNALIDKINQGIKFLHLPMEPIKNVTEVSLGWSKAVGSLIDKLNDERDVLIGLDKSTFDFKESTEGAKDGVDGLTDSVSSGISEWQGYANAAALAYDRMILAGNAARANQQAEDDLASATHRAAVAATQEAIALQDQNAALMGISSSMSAVSAVAGDSSQSLSALSSLFSAIASSNVEGVANAVLNLVKMTPYGKELADMFSKMAGPLMNIISLAVDVAPIFSPILILFRALLPALVPLVQMLGDFAGAISIIIGWGYNWVNSFFKPITDWLNWLAEQFAKFLDGLGLKSQAADVRASMASSSAAPAQPVAAVPSATTASTASTGSDVDQIGSFASGVRNFRGGIARVGEQGPELVRLPRGASVIPESRQMGGSTFIFNSPKALSPMEMRMQMMQASRRMAFETGGNL